MAAAALLATVPAAIAADSPAGEDNLEEIIVTGSRIKQRLEDAPVAVIVVDRDSIDRASQDAIGKVLQQLPINTGFSQNTNVNNGGDGTSRINLRGLGAERTVVLVNGRRFVYGGDGGDTSVDTNMIPLSLIQRAEVIGVGSSTIYGSDAIGGVVNLITREDYSGAEITGSFSSSDQNDGHVANAQFLAGQKFDKGYLTFGGEIVDQHAVLQGDRSYSKNTEYIREDGTIGTTGSTAIPQGRFRVPAGNALGLAPGFYTRVAGSGNPPTAADFRPYANPADNYNYAPFNYLQTPSQRQFIWLLGGYDLTDNVSAFFEGLLHHRSSQQQLAPTPFNTANGPAFGVPELPDGRYGIPANNYYNPFGVDLAPPRGGVTRRFSEAPPRSTTQDADTQWYVAGLRGKIGDTWSWELSADYGRNDTSVSDVGDFRSDHMALALGPSGLDAAGHIVCGTPDPVTHIVPAANVIAGCVPLNLFGGQGPDGKGTITKDQLNYVTGTLTDRGYNEQQVYELIFRGDWGTVQDRPIRWAAGGLHRVESAANKLDPAKLQGLTGGAFTNLNHGGVYTANEAYAEAVVPVLRDLPAADELNVTAGARFSSFSSFGSVTTYQGGIMYRPVHQLTLRGGYGRVFRAPSVQALFESNLPAAGAELDPCGNDPTPAQQANCAANGVPGGSYVQDPNAEYGVVTGGNRDLKPETGDSISAGITFTPSALPGLELSADYYRTSVRNFINLTPYDADTLNACADTGAASACSKIQRYPDGSISMLDSRYFNARNLLSAGYDFDIDYRTSLLGGVVDSRLMASYLASFQWTPYGGETYQLAGWDDTFGAGALPEWRGLGYLQYSRGPWSGAYQVQYIGPMKEYIDSNIPDGYSGPHEISDRWYQNVRFEYEIGRGPTVALAVNNLTGVLPPRVGNSVSANTDPAAYELLGRTYFVSLSYRIE